MWITCLNVYSQLSLTQPLDNLMALSGVARHLRFLDPDDQYLAGLVSVILISFSFLCYSVFMFTVAKELFRLYAIPMQSLR